MKTAEVVSSLSVVPTMVKGNASLRFGKTHVDHIQQIRLHNLLEYVFTHSPFYRDLYESHGIVKKDLSHLHLEDLPVIDKRIMMENFDRLVCDPRIRQKSLEEFLGDTQNSRKKYLERYQVLHTSGSSGKVGIFVYNPAAWRLIKALAISRVSRMPFSPLHKTRIAFIGATDGHYAGISLASDAPQFLFNFQQLNINEPLSRLCEQINQFKPELITGYASGIELLAQEQRRGTVRIRPRRIICSADPLTPRIRTSIRESFSVEPVDFYASSESLCMGVQCDRCHRIHLFSDWHCFESESRRTRTGLDTGVGTLIMTNLYNFVQPLIRYRLNDEAALDAAACTCGSPFHHMVSLAGRVEEFLWFERENGLREYIHPIVLVELYVPGLQRFQVIQTTSTHLLIRAVAPHEQERIRTALIERMKEILTEKLLDSLVTVSVELVDDIPNDSHTGKYKLIIPLT